MTIISDNVRILEPDPEFTIGGDGELTLTGGRRQRLIKIYTDPGGWRTLALAEITLR